MKSGGRLLAPYPSIAKSRVDQLFLAYTGYSLNPNAAPQYQFWEPHEFIPLLAHVDRSTGRFDGQMWTDFLFLALGILDERGDGKYLTRSETAPATRADWDRYTAELYACNRNLDALYQAVAAVPYPHANVWIALPYPNPSVFPDDTLRLDAVLDWLQSFLARWRETPFERRLSLQGFYWLQESIYYQGPEYDDRLLIRSVNQAIRRLNFRGKKYRTLWIPYQLANAREEWEQLGFDLALLQPNYYFNPERKLETAAAEAYANGQGFEMELDLAVTYDEAKRARFIEYMNLGATGGFDAAGNYFGPYMLESPLGWYTGGWYLGKNGRKQSIISLYQNNDPLYDQIYAFLNGTYPKSVPP